MAREKKLKKEKPVFNAKQIAGIRELVEEMLGPIRKEIATIIEFDTSVTKPMMDKLEEYHESAKRLDKILQDHLWGDTRFEAMEQFLADIVPEKYRGQFNNRVNRIEAMNPAASSAGQALKLADKKQKTESMRITDAEAQKRLARSEGAQRIGLKGGDGTQAYAAIPGYEQDEDGTQKPVEDRELLE